MLSERLLIINISVRTAKLFLWTHMYLTINIPMLIWRLVSITSILLLLIWKELGSKWFDAALYAVELICRVSRIFGSESTLSHIEILIFKLLDTAFKRPVFISELDQFGVNFVNRGYFGLNIFNMTTVSEFSILCVTLFHDVLDLSTYEFVIILAVIFQDAFYKF